MTWRSATSEARARAASLAILATGLASAVLIFALNGSRGNPTGLELEDSKQYLRTMEVYGGKANVFAADLRHWFSGLWHGRTLAFTVAVLAVIVALAVRVAATPLPPTANGGRIRKDHRPESDS